MVVGGVLVALFVVVVVVGEQKNAPQHGEKSPVPPKVVCLCVVCLRKEEFYRKSAFKSEGEKKVSKALPLSFQNFVPVVKKTEKKRRSFRV